MKIGIRGILVCSIIIICCGSILSFGESSQVKNDNRSFNNSPSNEEIIKLYQELIDIRQKAVEDSKRLWQMGQGNLPELVEAEIKAAEVRIQLAEFQGNKEKVIKELQNMVQTITEMRNSVKTEVEVGQRPQSWIYEIDGKLLETKIRLAKLKEKKADVTNAPQNESELRMRLNIANQITDLKMKNDALSVLALNASKSGIVELVNTILGQITELSLKNQTAGVCAINLSRLGKTQEALAITGMITDLSLKNEILLQIVTMK
jgi:gamma-glutamylcyclotransferase (GGCT)/AIG2-like uncharacterized protein YtfP